MQPTLTRRAAQAPRLPEGTRGVGLARGGLDYDGIHAPLREADGALCDLDGSAAERPVGDRRIIPVLSEHSLLGAVAERGAYDRKRRGGFRVSWPTCNRRT